MAITLDGTAGINTSGTLVATGSLTTSSNLTTGTGAIYDGIARATAVISTSGTSITFTSIPSWVKRITIAFAGVSTTGTNFLVQIGAGSVTTSGYAATSNQVANDATATGGFASTSGFTVTNRSSVGTTSGIMTLINLTGNQWVSSHAIKQSTTYISTGGGDVTLGGNLDRVVITTESEDTFDACSINILYE